MPTKPELGKHASASALGAVSRDGAHADPLIEIADLHVDFALRSNALARLLGRSSGYVRAVDGVDLTLGRGEVVGLVGESGSGKSTLGRALLGLVNPTSGTIHYDGRDLAGLPESQFRPLRRKLQMVFQDPHASLNPSMTIGASIGDALRIHGIAGDAEGRRAAVVEAVERVGLTPAGRFLDKYPGELSGGQKQRAVIARAIVLGPELLVADEPISMLDMSVRAKILGLLEELRRDLGLTYLYITHDLASARFFCDRIAIMYLGKIVEIGPVAEIFDNPRHPYTKALLRAVPDPDPSRKLDRDLPRGEIPDAAAAPTGCSFHPRCSEAFGPCGWEARDVAMVMEQRWTTVEATQYAEESGLLGEIAGTDLIQSPDPSALRAMLTAERDERPDDPLWTGVRGLEAQSRGLRMDFVPALEPSLEPVAGSAVSVSCHRVHPPPGSDEPRPDVSYLPSDGSHGEGQTPAQ